MPRYRGPLLGGLSRRVKGVAWNGTPAHRVFTRTWWVENPSYPNGLEPGAGPRSYRGHPRGLTEEEAQRYCRQWNETHKPGRLSRKAEYERE